MQTLIQKCIILFFCLLFVVGCSGTSTETPKTNFAPEGPAGKIVFSFEGTEYSYGIAFSGFEYQAKTDLTPEFLSLSLEGVEHEGKPCFQLSFIVPDSARSGQQADTDSLVGARMKTNLPGLEAPAIFVNPTSGEQMMGGGSLKLKSISGTGKGSSFEGELKFTAGDKEIVGQLSGKL